VLSPFHNILHTLQIKAASGRCRPRVRTVTNCLHIISLSRTASGQCCPVDLTDASCLPNPCLQRKSKYFSNSDLRPNNVALSSGRMHTRAIQKLLDLDGHPDAWLGHPDGNKGSDFFWVVNYAESSWNLWNCHLWCWWHRTCHNKAISILRKINSDNWRF
jgi:hypothetical protein